MPHGGSESSADRSPEAGVRRRKSYVEVTPGGPHVLLEPLPYAEEWIPVTKEIAYRDMPVFMDTPPLAQNLFEDTPGIVPHVPRLATADSGDTWETSEQQDPTSLRQPPSLPGSVPGSVGEESGRDRMDASEIGSMAESEARIPSEGQGAKEAAGPSHLRIQAPRSAPGSPHHNVVSEKQRLRPCGSFTYGVVGSRRGSREMDFKEGSGLNNLQISDDSTIRRTTSSMRTDRVHIKLPVRLICKIMNATQLPKPSHGSNLDPYCLLSVSNSTKKSRTRTLMNTEDPEWTEEFVYIIQDYLSSIHVEVMHKDVLKDELLGSVTIRCRDLLDNEMQEYWSAEYQMLNRHGQATNSVLFFQFKLELVTLDVIRFRDDENEGRLVEPFDDYITDIWKVRWLGSGEVGWYCCGFNDVLNLRCAVEWSEGVDDFKKTHGPEKLVRKAALRAGAKEIPPECYATVPSHMKVKTLKDARSKSFLHKSLRLGSAAGTRQGRNQFKRQRSDSEADPGISAVQRFSIGIGRRLSTMFARSPVTVENRSDASLQLPPLPPPVRRQSLQPKRGDSLANVHKPRRFSSAESLGGGGDHITRVSSLREGSMARLSSSRSIKVPSDGSFAKQSDASAVDPPSPPVDPQPSPPYTGRAAPEDLAQSASLNGGPSAANHEEQQPPDGSSRTGRYLSTISSNDGSRSSPGPGQGYATAMPSFDSTKSDGMDSAELQSGGRS